MWTHYRRWKSWLGVALVILAYFLIRSMAEGSTGWKAGIGIVGFLGIAYVVEEIVWMVRRQGRPCGRCGHKVPMKAFRILATCPHCGQALD